MKRLLFIAIALFAFGFSFAQAPQKMSYQAVIRNSSDVLVTNTGIGMQISILQGSSTGTPVFVERHFPTTNTNGLVSVEIGTGTLVSGSFSTINWSGDVYYLKTETDLNGGSTYTISGTSPLLSVPYALHSKTTESITGGETDPVFGAHAASGITSTLIGNWNTAFGWGNHASAGYLTSFIETDPLWTASPSFGVTNTNITNWNTAFGWGNHASAGYLTSFTETDPLWTASPSFGITGTNITNWNASYGWGNHALAGYLTSYSETDPLWSASPSFGITSTNITNWNAAYGWGNHALAGYLTSYSETDPIWIAASSNYYTKTEMQTSGSSQLHWGNVTNKPTTLAGYGITDAMNTSHPANAITGTDITNWNNNYVPAGVLSMFGGATPPSGYLLCDGSEVNRTTYAALFAAIGTTYGVGNGTTTFNLPDLRSRVPVGFNAAQPEFNTLNKTGGEISHVLTTAELAAHAHTGTISAVAAHSHTGTVNADGIHTHSVSMANAQSVSSTTTAPATWGAIPFVRDANGTMYNDGAYDELRFYNGAAYVQPLDIDFMMIESAADVTTGTSTTHTHTFTSATNGGHNHTIAGDNTGSGAAHNNLQPYIVVNYIIKF